MQHATEQTVLGDFGGATYTRDGVTSTFLKRDGKFIIRTDGPDGRLTDFEVKYTFGVEPQQQYLVELAGGRLQAVSVTWDTRPKAQGGQRWFRQYPQETLDHRDELHWTGRSQNWNFMCADCHSTDVRKCFDGRRVATTPVTPKSRSAANPVTVPASGICSGPVAVRKARTVDSPSCSTSGAV